MYDNEIGCSFVFSCICSSLLHNFNYAYWQWVLVLQSLLLILSTLKSDSSGFAER